MRYCDRARLQKDMCKLNLWSEYVDELEKFLFELWETNRERFNNVMAVLTALVWN